ncbi:two-component response regulator [Roseibium sp. TrichSKD4]|uniref:ANTAR domain-containing response regulator n=1 Tax=Roseibium sp. TrichSKD4 TaxID=744980 RepID=UPI0001E56FE8|nr:ANTAR domain-containing protein [Roseibium sp. TrichSKD4]EFO31166.1 two-component response regulator [Roseibium sp. TrichSKD4]
MESSLSILVIDDNAIRAAIIEQGLRDAGHDKVVVVQTVNGLLRRIADANPDVIVIDLENPKRDQLEHMFQVSRAVQRPIAMFVDHSDSSMIEAAVDAGVSAYIVDGLKRERVKPILDMAISRFRAYSKLTQDLKDARTELADRKTIDRAKGILMKTKGLSEQQAYDLLRKTAMSQSRKVIEVAQSLNIASGLLGD